MEEKRKLTTVEINSGFVEPVIKEEDYVLGGERSIETKLGALSNEIIREDGQWDKFLPDYEPQRKSFDTYGCTVFNGTNQVEIYEKAKFGEDNNYSDRAAYIMANIKPPGADPKVFYEDTRKGGLLNEEDLSWDDSIDTLEKYSFPNPLPDRLIRKAKQWIDYRLFKHEYLPRGWNGYVKTSVMKENLKKSPLAAAVQAWSFDGEKYVRTGKDTHWTDIVGWYDNDDWKDYDSYYPFNKRLDKDFKFKYVKRIYIEKKDVLLEEEIKVGFWDTISNWIHGIIKACLKS